MWQTSIVDSTSTDADSYDLATILAAYTARNGRHAPAGLFFSFFLLTVVRAETTYYETHGAAWQTGRAPSAPFRISATIRYPSAVIR